MAKATSKTDSSVEVLPAITEEISLARDTGAAITAFVAGVVAFFRKADQLEKRALARVEAAKVLVKLPPQNAAADELLQKFIRENTAEEKQAVEHWNPITSTVSKFHRYLTARRGRTTDAHAQAKGLVQPVHNKYVDDAKRAAALEQDRLRREAELQAQRDRDRDLQQLEDAALKAEAASADLSEREQRFVELVATGYNNATTSARHAGYKNPEAAGLKLMNTPKIQKAIAGRQTAAAVREQKAAVKDLPLDVADVAEVKPAISRSAGGYDRTTWSGELLDEPALITGILRGVVMAYTKALGVRADGAESGIEFALELAMKTCEIPIDLLRIHPPTLNVHAKALGVQINRWPGVRAKKTTSTV